jgi:hypothetical protein
MDWERVNVWTSTLYTLIHSLHLSRAIKFGNLPLLSESIADAANWVTPDCSYASVLLARGFGRRRATFRRDPNTHFAEISNQIIKMLIQDLVVILDEMMAEILVAHGLPPERYPQKKLRVLSQRLPTQYTWAFQGCLELVAARNILTHAAGKWNPESIAIVAPFVVPAPTSGQTLSIGFAMLFRYRKAMRTFLNQVA